MLQEATVCDSGMLVVSRSAPLLSIAEAAKLCRCSRPTLRKWMTDTEEGLPSLEFVKVKGRVFTSEAALNRFLAARQPRDKQWPPDNSAADQLYREFPKAKPAFT